MNIAPPLRLIDLTKARPFRLGKVQIDPASCEAVWPGACESVQPRVMHVLVALNEQRGQVVSHGDLILACWGGRIVGEDAIQRCIAKLRQLGHRAAAFEIETIPRIGYRLHTIGDADNTQRQGRDRLLRPAVLAILVAGVSLTAAVAFLRGSPAVPARDVVTIEPLGFVGGTPAQALAVSLRGDIVNVLAQGRLQTAEDASRAGTVLRGTVTRADNRLAVHLVLTDKASGTTLWSDKFAGPENTAEALSTAASVAVARNLDVVHESGLQPGYKLNPELVALHVRGSDLVRGRQFLDEGTPRAIYERMVAEAPGFALGHSMLALAYANEAREGPPGVRAAFFDKAEGQARSAIAIYPRSAGAAYDARYLMARTRNPADFVGAEGKLADGLRNAPEFAYLSMRECRFLTETGQARNALPYCQRALALQPFGEPIGHSYARALAAAGESDKALTAIDRAARYGPEHTPTRLFRLQLAAFGGRPKLARQLLHDAATLPESITRDERALMDRFLAHQGKWDDSDRSDLADGIVRNARADPMFIGLAVLMLARIDSRSEAFGLLRSARLGEFLAINGTDFLFQPAAAPLRQDPRFWTAAAELGLAKYWVERDRWPDMCGIETALAKCRADAAKALAGAAERG